MSESKHLKEYYIVKYRPDGEKVPYFFGTDWEPELPSIHLPTSTPDPNIFAKEYFVAAKTQRYEADLNMDQLLASEALILICDRLNVSYFSRPVKVTLYRGKIPAKNHFLFFPLSKVELMDKESSIYKESDPGMDQTSNQLDDNSKILNYDSITKFVSKECVKEDLLYCVELKEIVCSKAYKVLYESEGLIGVEFIPLDETYCYDPWSDFSS